MWVPLASDSIVPVLPCMYMYIHTYTDWSGILHQNCYHGDQLPYIVAWQLHAYVHLSSLYCRYWRLSSLCCFHGNYIYLPYVVTFQNFVLCIATKCTCVSPMCRLTGGCLLRVVHLLEQECARVQEERQRKEKDLQLSSQHLKFEMQTELQKKVCEDGMSGEWEDGCVRRLCVYSWLVNGIRPLSNYN